MTRDRVSYEWDIETCDEHWDIIDHCHGDSLDELLRWAENTWTPPGETMRLVLVRTLGNEHEGVVDRNWAYVQDGMLPEEFSDGLSMLPNMRVPKRFAKEFARHAAKVDELGLNDKEECR